MLILSNALSDRPDEGSLKVAACLASALKAACEPVTVISYERGCALTDVHLKLNKLLLNPALLRMLRRRQEPVLYLPFPTRALPMAMRLFLLSRLCPQKVLAVLPMLRHHGPFSRWLLKHSRVRIAALSGPSREYYASILGEDRVISLKAGVDLRRFVPVSQEQRQALKKEYGLNPTRPVLLHVGHLKEGRNLRAVMEAGKEWQTLIVVSTFTKQEEQLRQKLEQQENVTILDKFCPRMERLYQMSDAYFFPVTEAHNCIDVPLSCLEAAACGLPVITTDYGEMAAFLGKPGFFRYVPGETDLPRLLEEARTCDSGTIRQAVLDYDWEHAAAVLWENLR